MQAISKTSLVNKAFAIISRSAKSLGNLLEINVTGIIVKKAIVEDMPKTTHIVMHLRIRRGVS